MLSETLLKDVQIKKLLDEEKSARLENEFAKSVTICTKLLTTLFNRDDFENFIALMEYLTQRRNQSREAICSMTKYSLFDVLPKLNEERQITLLNKLIQVTEGKIFIELEYSQAVRK